MIYEFEIPGKIIGKGRPRLNSYTGAVYTPTRTKDYENLVMQYFMIKYPKFKQLEGRVSVEIVANFEVPKSTKKQDKILMLENKINPIKKNRERKIMNFFKEVTLKKVKHKERVNFLTNFTN